jgi:hypothetical protein
VLLRLAYLAVTHAFAAVRLLPLSDREKDAEILVLRHQIAVLERQLGGRKVRFSPEDRAFLAALLAPLPGSFYVGCGCLYVRTRCCDGTAISCDSATRAPVGRGGPDSRPQSARFGS